MLPFRLPTLCLGLLMLCTACERSEIRVYTVAKEAPGTSEAVAAAPAGGAPKGVEPGHPKIAYDTPASWTPTEGGQLGAVGFAVDDSSGKATVKITAMGSFAGKEDMLVNMWRQQVEAAPLPPEEARKSLAEVEIAGTHGQIFEVNGTHEGKPNRIVTAMLERPDGTWFFKLAGDDPAVAAQKTVFLEFLKSVRFQAEDAPVDAKAKTE